MPADTDPGDDEAEWPLKVDLPTIQENPENNKIDPGIQPTLVLIPYSALDSAKFRRIEDHV